jgi:hypothetical protein
MLCWEAVQVTGTDYTVFVHVFDAHGSERANADGPPRGGLYPTSAWAPGEVIEDTHSLPTIHGAYVSVGLYRPEDGERLRIDGAAETEFVIR